MSDSLPENSLSGILRVLKLVSGEEIISLVNEINDQITIKLPAKMENYYSKENGNVVEYVKLTNYLSGIRGHEVTISKSLILFMGQPNTELEKMYEVYFMAMQTDPQSIKNSNNTSTSEPGLQLLNDLFNNEDFVNFVNDLIDNFEGIEIIENEDDSEYDVESVISDPPEIEDEPKPKQKKRRKPKPEASKMPYDPELPPENPESWSDNPSDYL
jgi:hypothetical protein